MWRQGNQERRHKSWFIPISSSAQAETLSPDCLHLRPPWTSLIPDLTNQCQIESE
jgi:hypothetical protein